MYLTATLSLPYHWPRKEILTTKYFLLRTISHLTFQLYFKAAVINQRKHISAHTPPRPIPQANTQPDQVRDIPTHIIARNKTAWPLRSSL